jgi:hypothetical protein
MRMPWTKPGANDSRPAGSVSKSEAALSGAAGDGKVHDLEYWIASGFLTLPKDSPEVAALKP